MAKTTLSKLASETYLYLTTIGRVTQLPRTVELWFVVVRGKVYAISGNGAKANWVKNIQRNPQVKLHIGKSHLEGVGRVLEPSEQPLWDRVCRSACEKYGETEPWGTPVEFTVTAAK